MDLASGFVLATAAVLGLTHAFEPDHVAGISAVATGSTCSRGATLAGGAFGAGHALLVTAWVGLWYAFDGLGVVPSWVSALGTALVAVVLATLAAGLTVAALRRLIHRHEHVHDAEVHAHYHVHLPLGSHGEASHGEASHGHAHSASGYLKMGVLGALFTLSPPLSMIAFLATIVSTLEATVIWFAVGVYSLTIVVAMGTIGSSINRVTARLEQFGDRAHAALQLATATLLLVVAAHMVGPLL